MKIPLALLLGLGLVSLGNAKKALLRNNDMVDVRKPQQNHAFNVGAQGVIDKSHSSEKSFSHSHSISKSDDSNSQSIDISINFEVDLDSDGSCDASKSQCGKKDKKHKKNKKKPHHNCPSPMRSSKKACRRRRG